MRLIALVLILVVLGALASGEGAESFKLSRLKGTAQINASGDFLFTISPNDQWLVFIGRNDPRAIDGPPEPDVQPLRVLNLRSGELHEFIVGEDQLPAWLGITSETSWAPDSSLCILPPPPRRERRVAIMFVHGEVPKVVFLPHPHEPRKPDDIRDQVKMPEAFTCSDCFPHTNDFELLKKHIAKEYLNVGTDPLAPNDRSLQIVSPDGKRIYYQKGPQGRLPGEEVHATTLFEMNTETGKKRELIVHTGECPLIEELRPSPNGKKLAYQVTNGCGFMSTPQIYIMDLASTESRLVTHGSGSMHWSSSSDKLYFYRRRLGENHGDCLWVAESLSP